MNDNPNAPVPASGPAATASAAPWKPFWYAYQVPVYATAPGVRLNCGFTLRWPAEGPVTAFDAAAQLLAYYYACVDERVVFDPDSRRWLRYAPALGRFAVMPGTALEGARALIAEVAADCDRRWQETGGSRTRRDPDTGIVTITPDRVRNTWNVLAGQWAPDYPTVPEIAEAMVSTAAAGEHAAEARKHLELGRLPDLLHTPMTWVTRNMSGPVDPLWSGEFVYYLSDDYHDDEEELSVNRRSTRYVPDFDAAHPLFDELCALVTSDPETLLRLFSMGCTGIATKFVIYLIAETGQGKTLLASFLLDLLGNYAKSVAAKTLFGYNADPQYAAEELAGCRLAVVEEGIGDQSFKADAAFKLVTTGGGSLNARRRYEESRQEPATHTILLAINPEAAMNYADPAIMARLCPVRFTGSPAEIAKFAEKYNPSSEAWKREAPAVLATLLRYAREFASGAWKPKTLADLHAAGAHDAIGEALAEAVEMKTDTNVGTWVSIMRQQLASAPDGHKARELYEQYSAWTKVARREAVTETAFGRELAKCDWVTRKRERSGTVYYVAPLAIGQ